MTRKNPAKFPNLLGVLAGLFYCHETHGASIPLPKSKPTALAALYDQLKPSPPPEASPEPPKEGEHAAKNALTIEVDKEFGQIKIVVDGIDTQTPYALFRSDSSWLFTLSSQYPVKIQPFQAEDVPPLEKITTIEASDTTTILFHISPTYTPKIDFPNKKFTIIFDEVAFPAASPIIIRPIKEEDPVTVNFREAGEAFTVYDPETSKTYVGYTSIKPHDPIQEFSYPEIKLLPSLKGIAFDLLSDQLDIEDTHGKFTIKGISATPFQVNDHTFHPSYAFSLFEEFELKNAVKEKQALEEHLTSGDTLATYLQLAWTDISLGYIPEASGTLTSLTKMHPQTTLHPLYVLFSGIVKLLSHRAPDFLPEIKPYFRDIEIQIMANLIDIAVNPYESSGNMYQLVEIKPFILSLPQQLKDNLISFILIHGIYNKNLNVLTSYLKEEFIPKDPTKLPYYQLAYATYLSLSNKPKKAITYYEALAKNFEAPFIATVAEFELVNQKLNDNKIAPRHAIDILDRLRYQWRGDSLEYYITQRLISLLLTEHYFAKALAIMRKLIRYHPKQTQNDRVFQKMQEELLVYFTDDKPKNMLEMLSVFQEFGDIAPDTAQGDQVILKAIDCMIQLNLYSESARLLKNYLKKKTQSGVDSLERQAKILLRIAAIELMDRQGSHALKILKNAETWPIPFREQAIGLKADALISVKKFDEALAIIPQDSPYDLKRAHTYFKMENWQEAAHYYEKALNGLNDDAPKKAQLIINIAICYALQDHNDELKTLKTTYWDFMKTTPQKDVFAFLTSTYSPSHTRDLMTSLAYMDNLTGLAEHILHDTAAKSTS